LPSHSYVALSGITSAPIPETAEILPYSPRNENAKNDAGSSEIKIGFGSEGGIDQTRPGQIIGATTLA
jgi:hypothetical protein